MCASFLLANKKGLIKDEVVVIPKGNEKLEINLKNGRLYFKGRVKNNFIANLLH